MTKSEVAINWFAASFSNQKVSIPYSSFADNERYPRGEKTLAHTTVLVKRENRIYHLIESGEFDGIADLDFQEVPDVAKFALEQGFARKLIQEKFELAFRKVKVGGRGYYDTAKSIRPNIYRSIEGIGFRSFYFKTDEKYKFGLVLNYISSQRFVVSLEEKPLQQIALGKLAVPLNSARDDAEGKELVPSGIFLGVTRKKAILLDKERNQIEVDPSKLTLAYKEVYLLSYITSTQGEKEAKEVSKRIKQDELTLNEDGRINTSLAKDQITRLTKLLIDRQLVTFSLVSSQDLLVRIESRPLLLEGLQ